MNTGVPRMTHPPFTHTLEDFNDHSASLRMPGGDPSKMPRSTSMCVVNAMGHEVKELSDQNDSDNISLLLY